MAEGTHGRLDTGATSAGDIPPTPGRDGGEHAELAAEIDLTQEPARVDLHDPQRRGEVEAALTAVPGLVGARLVPGFDREVDEVHVLSTLERNPKQTVRDVQTVLMAASGSPPTTGSSASSSSTRTRGCRTRAASPSPRWGCDASASRSSPRWSSSRASRSSG